MIKIVRTHKPVELTDSLIREKTLEFIKTGKKVWGYRWLKRALLEMSHYKCAYCEKHLDLEDSYMEVEHFKPKSIYEDDVLKWENLLPTCKRCNLAKKEWDVTIEPIINPTEVDPKAHLVLVAYRYRGKTEVGKNTVECINLNEDKEDSKKFLKLTTIRQEIGDEVIAKLEVLAEKIDQSNLNQREKHKILNQLKKILKEAQPQAEYAATCSTVVLSYKYGAIEYYEKTKQYLININLWDDELQKLEDIAKSICLC